MIRLQEEGWVHQRVIDLVIWIRLKHIPIGEHTKRMNTVTSAVCYTAASASNKSAV